MDCKFKKVSPLSPLSPLSIALVLLIAISLFACSKQQMFNTAIDFERSGADLSPQSVLLESGEIFYLENDKVNSDSTIVMLHGFTGDKDNWNRFSSELKGDYHLISLDLLGHGQNSVDPTFDYSIRNQAKMLHEFMTRKKLVKVHLAGNSLGGAVAIQYIGSYSNTVKTLTLIDALGTKDSKQDFARLATKNGSNPLLNICDSDKYIKMMNTGMSKPPYVPSVLIDYLVTVKCARTEIESKIFKDMMGETDLTAITRNIRTPTLIIWGAKDQIFNVHNASLFAESIENSKVVVLKDLGHVPLIEDPATTAQVFERFVNKKRRLRQSKSAQ